MSSFLDDLDKWLLESVEKKAEEPPTALPKVDDGDRPAPTGARAAENESDVKSEIPAESVDEASGAAAEGPGRGENVPSNSIGTKAAPTGEDPSVETASVKAKPDDPGTSMPARADMGEKYSAAQLRDMGDTILADIAVATAAAEKPASAEKPAEGEKQAEEGEKSAEAEQPAEGEKSAEEKPAADLPPALKEKAEDMKEKAEDKDKDDESEAEDNPCPKSAEAEDKSDESVKQAEEAGKEAASLVTDQLQMGEEATSQASAEEIVGSVLKSAEVDAINVDEFLKGFKSKSAMPMPVEDVAPEAAGDAAPVMEDASDVGAVAEGPAEDDLAQIVQALIEAGVTPEELLALAEGGGEAVPAEAAAAVPAVAEEAVAAEAEAPKVAEAKTEPEQKAWKDMSTEEKKAELRKAVEKIAAARNADAPKEDDKKGE